MTHALFQGAEHVVLPEATEAANVGALVRWSLRGKFDPDALEHEWVDVEGLSDKLLPGSITPGSALAAAMREYASERLLCRPMAGHKGWCLIPEHAKDDEVTHDLAILKAKLDKVGRVTYDPPTHPLAATIEADYQANLLSVPHSVASNWLAATVMRSLGAVTVSDNGGLYFVAPDMLATLASVKRALENSTTHRLFCLPAATMGDAAEMVVDALHEEVEQECRLLLKDLQAQGTRAVGSRTKRVEALQGRIAKMETMLGRKLSNLHEQAEEADGLLAAAMLAASADL